MTGRQRWRPHDLVRITDIAEIADALPDWSCAALQDAPFNPNQPALPDHPRLEDALPGWASASLAVCPWVVVRRAPHPFGLIPIGVRGPDRWQRHAALVPSHAVTRTVSPEDLRARRPADRRLAVTLSAVASLLANEPGGEPGDGGLVWGPTGGVGFELATGRVVTHSGSDLDLLVRTPHRLDRARAAHLATAFAALPARVDCQLDTPLGGIALADWARPDDPVMVRTDHGPELVDDPWALA
ncbi:malonate decarboxylase holo-ACP synthase [Sphaerisporangium sp. NPDC005289]|uniref:malonate decarboxylase holo-ACP synthase n=1 Tax=Sphaerisporangium sp. NPDC005289 TaxID=3155247 RepID=UPI0033B9D268